MLSSMAPSALSHGDGAPGAGAEDCMVRSFICSCRNKKQEPSSRRFWRVELGSLPRRRPTRRRVFPAPLFCADCGGLSIGWISCWTSSGCGVESVLLEGCPRTTTGVSQCWFSGHFRKVFFNTIALPRINIDASVWGESSIMTGVYQRWCSSTLHIGWGLCDRVCQVLV